MQTWRPPLEAIYARDTETYTRYLRTVQRQMEAGAAKESMATICLSGGNEGLDEVEVAYALSAPFSAGLETTLSTVKWGISMSSVTIYFFLSLNDSPKLLHCYTPKFRRNSTLRLTVPSAVNDFQRLTTSLRCPI